MEENESFFKEFVIPKIDVKSIKSKFTLCDVPIPNWIDDEIKSGKGMIKTIISLKDFSSTYQNIYRQVSKTCSYFFISLYQNYIRSAISSWHNSRTYRNAFNGRKPTYRNPYLFWAILISQSKYRYNCNAQIGMFLEFFKLRGLLSEIDYSKILSLFVSINKSKLHKLFIKTSI